VVPVTVTVEVPETIPNAQLQAEVKRTAPEQADAYVGTVLATERLGMSVVTTP
jgi:hypothetical protein